MSVSISNRDIDQSVTTALMQFATILKDQGPDAAWLPFYSFIIRAAAYPRQHRPSISQLVKVLEDLHVSNVGDYVFCYAHCLHVLHLKENGKIEEGFAP